MLLQMNENYTIGKLKSRAHKFTPVYFGGVRVARLFSFLCCPILCLRSEFRVVMSVTIFA